jgi:hypothetical protein
MEDILVQELLWLTQVPQQLTQQGMLIVGLMHNLNKG